MAKKEEQEKKSIGNILTTVAFIILVPVLLVNLWIIFQSKTNEDKVPSVFGIKPFIVLSGSMESEIHKGDLIFTKEVDPSKLGIDDVIAFRDAEGTVTTHRIIDMVEENGKTFFITKGDNNNTQDLNLVAFEDVEGEYLGRLPGLGSMMDGLSNPTTLVIVILGITVIFVIGFSISNKKDRELERLEYLEFKRMKEEMMAGKKSASKTKKTKSIKAEEDEDEYDEDDELLDEDEDEEDFDEEEEIEEKPRKKKATVAKAKSSTTKKQPAKKATSTKKTTKKAAASKTAASTKAKASSKTKAGATKSKKVASTKSKASTTQAKAKTKTTSTAKASSKKQPTKSTSKKTK